MADAQPSGFLRFATKLHHCRSTEQGISVEQLADCMMDSGFPAHHYRYQSAPDLSDRAWLAAQLRQIERTGDVSTFERDANTFLDALARCLPRAEQAADRLTLAWMKDELANRGLRPSLLDER